MASSTTEFHVEQTGTNNIGVGAGEQKVGNATKTAGACT
jgi:hypothetical protein